MIRRRIVVSLSDTCYNKKIKIKELRIKKKKKSVNIRRISIVGNDTLATNHLPAIPVLLSSVVKISKEA